MLASHFELYAVSSSPPPNHTTHSSRRINIHNDDDDCGENVVMHAMYNGTPAHPYMPPSSHDVDTLEYATIRLATLQTIQVEAYKQLRKQEAEVFLNEIDFPFAIIKEDERWLKLTKWRERSSALLAQCEGEKSGAIVTIDASDAFDYYCSSSHHHHNDGVDNNNSNHYHIVNMGDTSSSQLPPPISSISSPQRQSAKVFTIGIQEEDARVEIYRIWVIEYRAVLPLQKRFLRMKREESDAAFKEEQNRRSQAAWLESVVLDHVNSQEVILREEARERDLLHTRGVVWQRRLFDQATSGASLIRLQKEYEPDMRAALVYSEALTRSQLDTSRGVLASLATLKKPPPPPHQSHSEGNTNTTTSSSSKAGGNDVVYYSSFDLRAKLWASGGSSSSGGAVSVEDALLRESAEESMEREFIVIEESCQRQYVLMMLFRDLQFTKWISEKLHPRNSNRFVPIVGVESTSASQHRPPIPVAPSAQPL